MTFSLSPLVGEGAERTEVCVREMSIMVRSAAKPRVSNHEVRTALILRDAGLRPAPQDEARRARVIG